jgi:hypothetical protein
MEENKSAQGAAKQKARQSNGKTEVATRKMGEKIEER